MPPYAPIGFQEIIFINGFSPNMDIDKIVEYILSNYGNQDQVWSIPLTFPDNSVSQTN